AIRRHVSAAMTLDDYREQGDLEGLIISQGHDARDVLTAPADGADATAFLREAVRARRNILISGGTSSGKTTFLNALLREVGSDERLILIEDTPELQVTQPNVVGLLAARGNRGEADVTPEDLLVASLRMRPDRIILGEIRGREALTFLRAINTGHPGSMSTIHADSPEGAIDQLAMLILQAGTQLSWENVVHYAARSIDVVVQLGRDGGRRGVRKVWVPGG
ncbi:MAG: ATPase, T2SS/T4P/T4SS family, partial [Novosphingobium sp.]